MNENRTIPDELLGAAIQSARVELLTAIHAAQEAGLMVSLRTFDGEIIGRRGRQIATIEITVARPI